MTFRCRVEKLSRQSERSEPGRQSNAVGERQAWDFKKFSIDKTTGCHSSDRGFERGMNINYKFSNLIYQFLRTFGCLINNYFRCGFILVKFVNNWWVIF